MTNLWDNLFPPEDIPYFTAVGRLIVNYADAENAINMAARRLSGLDDPAARILFAGMRFGELSERLRGLIRIRKIPTGRRKDLTESLDQLGTITTERNRIVHRSTQYLNNALVVTNALIAKAPDSHETHVFTLEQLENMALDCSVAYWRIIRSTVLPKDDPPEIVEFLRQPWRYKPHQPKNKHPPRGGAPGSRKHRPRPSWK